jgi:hypothetical protein
MVTQAVLILSSFHRCVTAHPRRKFLASYPFWAFGCCLSACCSLRKMYPFCKAIVERVGMGRGKVEVAEHKSAELVIREPGSTQKLSQAGLHLPLHHREQIGEAVIVHFAMGDKLYVSAAGSYLEKLKSMTAPCCRARREGRSRKHQSRFRGIPTNFTRRWLQEPDSSFGDGPLRLWPQYKV